MNNTPLINQSDYNQDLDFVLGFSAEPIKITVPIEAAGERLDSSIAKLLPEYSRSRLTEWIKSGHITVNNQISSPKQKLIGGEIIIVTPQETNENLAFKPEQLPLDIIYEDSSIIIINKPANLVVHPAAGNWSGTLLNGLLHHCPELQNIPRAGIVHRLDKDTSGLMVVAKTLIAQHNLVKQLQDRTVKRIYRAIADGIVPFDGKIETQIGRDPYNRTRMGVLKFGGKKAITHVKVLEKYANHSYIECALETGRTHQIRVHMREAKHPLAGDPVYGNPRHPATDTVKAVIKELNRQALHAFQLSFIHPDSQELVKFQADIPEDMYYLLSVLRLESGKDSVLAEDLSHTSIDNDNWNEDDYDVEVIYTRD